MKTWWMFIALCLEAGLILGQCPSGTTGYMCTACNVTSCDNCDTNINVCQTCSSGFYLDGDSCTECPTKCLSCSTNTLCDKCTPGYESTYDDAGNNYCVFYWWKWFLIVFGTLLGIVLIGLLVWWAKNKLKDEESGRQVQYEMKNKLQNTQANIKS